MKLVCCLLDRRQPGWLRWCRLTCFTPRHVSSRCTVVVRKLFQQRYSLPGPQFGPSRTTSISARDDLGILVAYRWLSDQAIGFLASFTIDTEKNATHLQVDLK
jgi:hypothetical protein